MKTFSKALALILRKNIFITKDLRNMGISVFKGGGLKEFFQIHSKGLYKHPNDSRNHPE